MYTLLSLQYESEAPIKKAPPIVSSSSSSSLKESRRSGRNKQLRKKKPIGSVSDAPPTTDVAKETEPKPDKPEKLEKEASVEDQEVLSQEEVPVAMTMSEVSEDSRKTEDSLAVINRQAEVGEVKEKVSEKREGWRERERSREREREEGEGMRW